MQMEVVFSHDNSAFYRLIENLDASKNYCGSSPQQQTSLTKDKVDAASVETSSSKKFWNIKYTLRGHFDSVRNISFYKNESAIISGSDDGTIKVWNFNKTQVRLVRHWRFILVGFSYRKKAQMWKLKLCKP